MSSNTCLNTYVEHLHCLHCLCERDIRFRKHLGNCSENLWIRMWETSNHFQATHFLRNPQHTLVHRSQHRNCTTRRPGERVSRCRLPLLNCTNPFGSSWMASATNQGFTTWIPGAPLYLSIAGISFVGEMTRNAIRLYVRWTPVCAFGRTTNVQGVALHDCSWPHL